MALTTNFQLEDACKEYRIPLVGVFSKNELKDVTLAEGGYIINMCDSHDENGNPLGGTHWVACWVEKQRNDGQVRSCYFDSFGVAPPVAVQRFLGRLRPYPYCTFQIQNINSGVCGYYCLEFLWFMKTERLKYPTVDSRFDEFLERYSYNPKKNRRLLEGFLKDIR